MIYQYNRHRIALLATAVAALLAASACASTGNSASDAGASPSATPPVSSADATTPTAAPVSSAARDLLPANIKSRGTVIVATESSYPPFVYAGPDGKSLVGVDIDLGDALGKILGVKFDWKVSDFSSLIPGVVAGRYDMSFDALYDTPDRRKQQDFLDYVKAGSGLFVPAGSNSHISGLNDTLCGHSIGVTLGTVEASLAEDFAKKCTANGKASSKVDNFSTEEAMFLALTSGRDESILVSASVGNYTAKQSGDKFKQIGGLYGVAGSVQGMTFAKENPQLIKAIQAALQELMDNGQYAEIMKKYEMDSVALTEATINTGLGLH